MYSKDVVAKTIQPTISAGIASINSPPPLVGIFSCVAASQRLFEQIWNVFIKILKSDVLSDGHAVVTEADLRETYGGGSSTGPTSGAGGAANLAEDHPPDLRMLRVTLMRQLLINASLQACLNRQRHSVAVIDQADGRRSRDGDGPLRMDLGLHCQETEFLRARVVKGLRGLVRALETDASERVVSDALQALWDAIWSDEDVDLIATQLLYADSVYAALPQALSEAGSLLTRQGLDPAALETSLRPYTWLYGDRDGRPHDTDAHTERLIDALEKGIRANYRRDLADIAQEPPRGHPASDFFQALADRLDSAHPKAFATPEQILAELQACDWRADERVRALALRIGVFGFHYLKIEFRQNAAMFTEVVDSIIPSGLIAGMLGSGHPSSYAELSTADRVELLTRLHGCKGQRQDLPQNLPEELWRRFWNDNSQAFYDKAAHYQGRDYIDIYNVDRAHIRILNAVNTLNTLKLLKTYHDRITLHGIAEAGNIDEPLALLFLLAAAGHRNGVDIALQPEDLAGAESMLQQIEDLYTNPVYLEHLELRGRRQFITFGPSDTGKQGGKAMHIANMQIAKLHRAIARRFRIELVPSIVIGYEHARSNGPIAENLEAFDAFAGHDVRYMLSGILEMRSHLLTPVMAHQCLRDLFLANAMRRPPLGAAKPSCGNELNGASRVDWIAIVRLYKQRFFEHPVLPALLRGMARFDIVRANSKSTRPPSRAFDVQELESRPDAIRAIPWTRALMLSGVHHELIGASLLATRDGRDLQDLYRADATFRGYVKNMAYAAARTRMELAWRTLTGTVPAWRDVIALATAPQDIKDARQLLASIHAEYVQAKRLVHKALYGAEPDRPEGLTAEHLLSAWPLLAQEVAWKEREIDRYVSLLVATRHEGEQFSKAAIQDIYSGFILSANTDLHFYATEEPGVPRQESDDHDDEYGRGRRHHPLRTAV